MYRKNESISGSLAQLITLLFALGFLSAASPMTPKPTTSPMAEISEGEQDGNPGPDLHLQKFVDALPILPSIKAMGVTGTITLREQQLLHRFHRDLPESPVWGYEGSSPGPTIEVQSGQPLKVLWKNELPLQPLIPAPTAPSGMGAMPGMDMPGMNMGANLPAVRTVTHLHGAEVSEPNPMNKVQNNDGWPDAWITPGQQQLAEYPNQQSARLLWYHDHAVGTTARNVYAGLLGLYLIHDDYEKSLNLPSGAYDIPLLIQSRSFNADGSIFYPKSTPSEFYGNLFAVNGKIWPYLEVEPRKYRFRIINTSNARSIALKILDEKSAQVGPLLVQITSDGGFLQSSVILNHSDDTKDSRLILSPSERADVIVDFSHWAGKNLILNNNSQTDSADVEPAIPEVMLFKVKNRLTASDTSTTPLQMKPIRRMNVQEASKSRKIILSQTDMADGSQMLLLNGKNWDAPISEMPELGSTEIWELVNTTDDTHPFHVHLINFQVLDRTPFDAKAYLKDGTIKMTGPSELPDANEMGWKDTVRASPAMVTRIIMKFAPYTGFYVYHCHILEHEDMDMMRPFLVVTPGSGR